MNERKNIKIIFLGADNFSIPIFLELVKNFSVLAIITEIDKPAGRHLEIQSPPIKPLAQRLKIPCWQPLSLNKNPQLYEKISALAPDVIITAAYGKIIPPAMLNITPHGCLNVHPSLLPKYRGASPIETALLNGDETTGITIILMDEGLDSGDIIAQEMAEISPEENYTELSKKLALSGASLLVKTLPLYLNQSLKLLSQDDARATYTYKIKKEDGRLNWRESSRKILNKIRAFNEWPRSFTFYQGQKLDITAATLAPEKSTSGHSAGQTFLKDDQLYVQCGKGIIKILRLKPAGKNEMFVPDYLNGHRDFIGSVLGN